MTAARVAVFLCVVPGCEDSKIISNIALFSVKDFTKKFLKLVAHFLTQVRELVSGDIGCGTCCAADFALRSLM